MVDVCGELLVSGHVKNTDASERHLLHASMMDRVSGEVHCRDIVVVHNGCLSAFL